MTNNISNSARQATFFEPSPIKLVVLTTVIMLICIFCSGLFIYLFTQNQAKVYTQEQVDIIITQAQTSLTPMILVQDTLNMNFYLKTLTQANFIEGATLVDAKQNLLARAGDHNETAQLQPLFNNQIKVGELTLFIDHQPAAAFFQKLLSLIALLTAATTVLTLFAIAIFAKKIMREFSLQYKPLLEHRFSMELAQAQSNPEQKNTEQQAVAERVPIDASSDSASISLAIIDLNNGAKDANHQQAHLATPSTQDDSVENRALVSLLKPDTQERMPHFKPFHNQPDTGKKHSHQPPTVEIELSESTPESEPKTRSKLQENPLFRAHPHEEQLDLYSLEHQTELNLAATDAAYVLFIDCSSGRAPIENPEEHQHLLSQYRRLIQLVIGIYGGSVELLATGDIRVMFNQPDAEDSHGIKALCAAKLFNQLYKYYNHRQITRMQPTLNLQVSLVRGNRNKLELLREEAHFLTRTTESNELISHTPLSEVIILRDTLLDGATTQRREEDKILILSLSPKYQELLEKQARHLTKSL